MDSLSLHIQPLFEQGIIKDSHAAEFPKVSPFDIQVFLTTQGRRGTNAALSLPLLFINEASAHTTPAPTESRNWPVCSGLYVKWQELHSLTPQTKLFTQLW